MSKDITKEDKYQQLIGAISVILGPLNIHTAHSYLENSFSLCIDIFQKYPGIKLDRPEIWDQLKPYAGTAFDTLLESRLHELHRHPDFEYESIESGRKQSTDITPTGHGWVINTYLDEEGQETEDFDRDDLTDTEWYRRLKSDARFDSVDPFDRKRQIVLEKLSLFDLLLVLMKNINAQYFPIPEMLTENNVLFYRESLLDFIEKAKKITRPEFNSKPKYIEYGRFLDCLEPGFNVYNQNPLLLRADNDDVISYFNGEPLVHVDSNAIYYYIETDEVDVLINLKDPLFQSFVRVDLKGMNKRDHFVQWVYYQKLAIKLPYDLV